MPKNTATDFFHHNPRPGRTGRTMEQKTRYQRRLNQAMRYHLRRQWCAEHLDRAHVVGPVVQPWGSIPLRAETIALVKLLQANHTGSVMGEKVSLTEVLSALIAAGLPVLLKEKGWAIPDAGA